MVRVVAGCVCGSDLWPYRGLNPAGPPRTIGHECVGVVEEVGSAVTTVGVGDFVVVPFCHSDNTCPHCQVGAHSVCEHLGFTVSGQAEYARVTQADGSLVKVNGDPTPADLPGLLALSDVMPTGWHAAMAARVRPGQDQTVVVVGDGAVGLCGVLAATTLGAARVIVMSRHASRQAVARQFGATDVVAERGDDAVAAIRELTGGVGADAVLECVGTGESMRSAIEFARPGATVGFVGVPHGVELDAERLFRRNVGLAGGMAPVRAYLPDLLHRFEEGSLDAGAVFDLTLPLDEAAEAYRAMDERRAIKALLTP